MHSKQGSKKNLSRITLSILVTSCLIILLLQLSPVNAQEGVASFTDVFSDEGIDTNDDGLFEFLQLSVEVNVTVAGTDTVDVGVLYDPEFITIDPTAYVSVQAQNSTYLDVGVHVVNVALNGSEIYVSGINPSTVASINLYVDPENNLDQIFDRSLSRQYLFSEFQSGPVNLKFTEIEREIMLDQMGSIFIANSYHIINLGSVINRIEIGIPENAYGLSIRDEMGTLEITTENGTIDVNLRDNMETNETQVLYLFYNIPWENHISHQNGVDYTISFSFFEQFNSTIEKLTTSITLPKGAQFKSSIPIDPNDIEKSDLFETVIFYLYEVTPSQDLHFNINYRYLVFWSSLYPTIWIGIMVFAASIYAFFHKIPQTSSTPIIPVQPKALKNFVDLYEEKTRIRAELGTLNESLRKGKIPRRRYKVRKRMLGGRLSTLSKKISSLSGQIRSTGPTYSKMLKQIEVAETNLKGAEKDIHRVRTRYRRGEITKDMYKKLIEENKKRIEEAEVTIDGIILRLHD
jgi:hypothetical protein